MAKLSGACGKLMCCLKYEEEAYKENLEKMPKVGDIVEVEGEEEKGKVIKKERYYGQCSRSFYISDDLTVEDIKASYKNGTLSLEVPKKDEQEKEAEKQYVQIED